MKVCKLIKSKIMDFVNSYREVPKVSVVPKFPKVQRVHKAR
jgi:hypothetical protein